MAEQAEQAEKKRGEQSDDHKGKLPTIILGAAAVALIVVVVLVMRFCSAATTIDITVNGSPLTIHGAKTMQTAIKESGLPINPGDYISIRGTILQKTAGHPFYATVNGTETVDPDYQLRDGDTVTLADGKDIVEEYDTTEETTPHGAVMWGAGALHKFTPGTDGVVQIRVGRESGEVVTRQVSESTDAICVKYNPEVGDDKVLALTFSDGPSNEYTADILDVLQENEARATFFCVGTEIEKYNDGLVQREHNEGHQVCTGTYDGGKRAKDGAIASLDRDQMVDEVARGQEVIASALNDDSMSRMARLPGNNLTEDMIAALDDCIDVEVGWNVDTGDWLDHDNTDEIYKVLLYAEPGDIILLHDGGGDRAKTVNALRRALPVLKQRGFSFVTVDELMDYPAQ